MEAAIMALLETHRVVAVLLGSFFLGDSVMFAASYLAGQLQWPIVPLLIAGLVGAIGSDSAWYGIGRILQSRFEGSKFLERERAKASEVLGALVGERPRAALVYVKFLYGARVATILYAATHGIPFWTFTLYNSIGILLWFVIFLPLGYLTGMGVATVIPYVNALEAMTIVLLISFVGFRVLSIWLRKRVVHE